MGAAVADSTPRTFTLPAGHVALITGSRRGIGLACAEAFLAAGGTVALADIDEDDLRAAQARIDPNAQRTSIHVADLSDPDAAEQLVAATVAAHGRLDALVNAAALLDVTPAIELSAQRWDDVFAVNARASFLLATAAARHFVANEVAGRIVLFGSIVAHVARPNNIAYCASKAAVVQMVRCLALELGPHGITTNIVAPGSTATEMLVNGQLGNDPQALRGVIDGDATHWRLGIPLGRLASPSDQAAVALFLATDAGRHLNGVEIPVDGGQSVV